MSDSFLSDVRRAVRTLMRQPGPTLLVILSLGLGIGAAGAVFTAVNALLMRDPPFREPDRLVRITSVRGDEDGGALAVPELDDLLALPVIDDAAMYSDEGMYNASGSGTPEELQATITTHNLFRVLGVEPLLGSTFPATFDRSRNFGLVISHGLWTRMFGRDPAIVGRTMTLDGAPGYTIYGVTPPDFNFPSHSDLFRSSGIARDPEAYRRRDVRGRLVVARLRSGIGVDQAQSALDGLARRLEREFPSTNAGLRFRVTSLREMYSAGVRPYVLLLAGAVILVLIVACANVANLFLSWAIARDREVALRTALGAGRWRLLRQWLAESLVLASASALAGGVLAVAGVRAVAMLVAVPLPPWMAIRVDAPVMVCLAASAAVAAVVTALAPGLRSPAALHATLKEGARATADGPARRRVRHLLLGAEIALAVVLVSGAGLMVQSVWRLQHVELGFSTADTLTFRVQLGWAAYETAEERLAFHERVLARLRALPGAAAVTFDSNLPMSGTPRQPFALRVAGQATADVSRNPYVHLHAVGPDYFAIMGIAIRRGRGFDARDRSDTVPVAVISERLAERLWPGRDPIGQQFEVEDALLGGWRTVVGVASAVRHHDIERGPDYDVYEPYTQQATDGPYYVIRTTGDPMRLAQRATAIIGETDPNQSFLDVQTYDRRIANRLWQHRLAAALIGVFAALTMVLAVVGLYGILSYAVVRQTREIGVRLALGATPRSVAALVVRRGLTLALAGAAAGVALTLAAARVAGHLLYDVNPLDPLTLAGAVLLLLTISAAACVVPARRATRVDPIVALRAD